MQMKLMTSRVLIDENPCKVKDGTPNDVWVLPSFKKKYVWV